MMMLLLALMVQTSGWQAIPERPTVGDTVRLWRHVAVDVQVMVTPDPLAATEVMQPLADPLARVAEGRLLIEYEVAFFATGTQLVAIPAAELLYADGRVEILPGEEVTVTIFSVLPDSVAEPRASLGPYTSYPRRRWVMVVLVSTVVAATAMWGMRRRRVGPRPAWAYPHQTPGRSAAESWIAAGEGRAVVALANDAVRARIAAFVPACGMDLTTDECLVRLEQERPDWPIKILGTVLGRLDRARFAPAVSSDVIEVIEAAEELVHQLEQLGGGATR